MASWFSPIECDVFAALTRGKRPINTTNGGGLPKLPQPGPVAEARPRLQAGTGNVPAAPPQVQTGPLRVGHVISVSGGRVSGILHSGDNASYVEDASVVQIGAMLKMATPKSQIFGNVREAQDHQSRAQGRCVGEENRRHRAAWRSRHLAGRRGQNLLPARRFDLPGAG